MAFKIAQNPKYTVVVKVFIPADNGKFDESSFKATFKRVNMDELDELRKKSQIEVVKEVLMDYSDLIDDDGNQVEYSPENLEILMNIPQALAGIAEAFWSSIFKAKEKN
jgi:Ni,Fe-hydrogenase III component G